VYNAVSSESCNYLHLAVTVNGHGDLCAPPNSGVSIVAVTHFTLQTSTAPDTVQTGTYVTVHLLALPLHTRQIPVHIPSRCQHNRRFRKLTGTVRANNSEHSNVHLAVAACLVREKCMCALLTAAKHCLYQESTYLGRPHPVTVGPQHGTGCRSPSNTGLSPHKATSSSRCSRTIMLTIPSHRAAALLEKLTFVHLATIFQVLTNPNSH